MAQDPTGVRYRGDPQTKDERIGALFPERYLFNTNHPEVFKAYIGGTQDAKDDEILKFLEKNHIKPLFVGGVNQMNSLNPKGFGFMYYDNENTFINAISGTWSNNLCKTITISPPWTSQREHRTKISN